VDAEGQGSQSEERDEPRRAHTSWSYGYGTLAVATMDWGRRWWLRWRRWARTAWTASRTIKLAVEDAATLAKYDVVVFVDADASGPEPFWFDHVQASRELSFSSTAPPPAKWLALAREMFGAQVKGLHLGIRRLRSVNWASRYPSRRARNLALALPSPSAPVCESSILTKYTRQFGVDSGRGCACDPRPRG